MLIPALTVLLSLSAAPALAQDDAVYWGALHEHSGLSRERYGFTAEQAYEHMLVQAGLSFGAVTDYDWSLSQLDTWDDAKTAANRFHCPVGATSCYDEVEQVAGHEALAELGDAPFVTLLAYEWNNNSAPDDGDPTAPEYGHRNVYFLDAGDPEGPYKLASDQECLASSGCAPLVVSGEGREEGREDWATWFDPCALWTALDALDATGLRAFTVPHHVALSVSGAEGDALWGRTRPTATDWSWHPEDCPGRVGSDPARLEPLVELYSTWGSGEHAAMDLADDPIDGLADPERVVRDVALAGAAGPIHRLGFIGSGDNHSGNAGEDPQHSFLVQPGGDFQSYLIDCDPDADCTLRYGRTGLVGVRLDTPLSRAAVFDALQDRHTVATTGERFELRVDLVVDDVLAGVQGDDLRGVVELAHAQTAVLEVVLDLGTHAAATVEVLVAGTDGAWQVHAVTPAQDRSTWSGTVALVTDGQPADWLPTGELVLYLRVAAAPQGALEVPDGAAALAIREPDGTRATLTLPPGRTTATGLIAAWDAAVAASGLGLDHELTHGVVGTDLFAIQARDPVTGDAAAVTLETAAAPGLAHMLGFRDDADTPAADSGETGCSPCIAAVAVDGGELVEQAWASPIWLDHQPGTDTSDSDPGSGDTGEPPVVETEGCTGCGLGRGPGSEPLLALLLLGGLRRRRC